MLKNEASILALACYCYSLNESAFVSLSNGSANELFDFLAAAYKIMIIEMKTPKSPTKKFATS